jgi:hypothetical protein
MDARMSVNQLVDGTLTEAWECYHGFMTNLPTAAWKIGNSPRDSTMGCHKKLRSTYMPLLEEPSSCSTLKKHELFLRSFPLVKGRVRSMALTQPTLSETHQVEQEILAQPFDGKKTPMSRISSNAILDKLQNRLSGLALPTVPCILGPFMVHHALCD